VVSKEEAKALGAAGVENPDGTVTIVAHRSEMGCGSRTALPLVVTDELDADWSRVRIEQATGDPKYGDQDTDGSHSVRSSFDLMRQVGATGRATGLYCVTKEQAPARTRPSVRGSGRQSGAG